MSELPPWMDGSEDDKRQSCTVVPNVEAELWSAEYDHFERRSAFVQSLQGDMLQMSNRGTLPESIFTNFRELVRSNDGVIPVHLVDERLRVGHDLDLALDDEGDMELLPLDADPDAPPKAAYEDYTREELIAMLRSVPVSPGVFDIDP